MRSSTRYLLVAAIVLSTAAASFGSGFQLFEQGAKAVAMSGAFAATADDPSAIFYNVAGIAQLRRPEVLVGGTAIGFSNEFVGDPNDPFTSGATAHYRRHTFVLPNAYVTVPVGENLTFGVGVMTPFGLRTNWSNPWIGRFIASDSNIKTVDVEPAVAWKTSDGRLMIGAGADYRRSHIVLQRNNGAINPFTNRLVDVANVWLNSDWSNAWGWNVGVLWKPSDLIRLGASYRSDMTIDYTGNAQFTQIATGSPQLDAIVKSQLPPNQSLKTSIPYPATTYLAIGTGAIKNWDAEFDITHTNWSKFKQLDILFSQSPSNNLHRVENWKDTNSYRVGLNHPATEHWDVRFGALYDENPEPTSVVGPLLPDANRRAITFGAGYHPGRLVVDWSVMVLRFQTRSTNGQSADAFNGTYSGDATLFSMNLGYKF